MPFHSLFVPLFFRRAAQVFGFVKHDAGKLHSLSTFIFEGESTSTFLMNVVKKVPRFVAARRVLGIPEILDFIFSYNDSKDAARCMIVCKCWRTVALKFTWTHVVSFKQIFNALAPLSPCEKDSPCLTISRHIVPPDWLRALPKFAFTKTMCLNMGDRVTDYAVIEFLVSRRKVDVLFPCLERLKIVLDAADPVLLRLATIFLHSGVKHLQFDARNAEALDNTHRSKALTILVTESTGLCPNIEHLDFLVTGPMEQNKLDLLASERTFLAGYRNLRIFCAPCELLQHSILFFLGHLTELKEVHSYNNIEARNSFFQPRYRCYVISPIFKPLISFKNLAHLELCDAIQSVVDFLIRYRLMFPKLDTLEINAHWSDDAAHIKKLIGELAIASPSLKRLTIARRCFPQHALPSSLGNLDPIHYSILCGLAGLTKLEVFRLAHAWPVKINDEELTELVSICPALRVLELNSNPLYVLPSSITLDVLGMISHRCPWIESLALFIQLEEDLSARVSAIAEPSILNFKELSFGRTYLPAHNENYLVPYLALTVSPACGVDVDFEVSCSMLGSPDFLRNQSRWFFVSRWWKIFNNPEEECDESFLALHLRWLHGFYDTSRLPEIANRFEEWIEKDGRIEFGEI
ncbi:hypothetical protein SCHPADRAFT_678614 [Schizopora paradoxa]|uniref:F-box domain-containing protein n=1 Tax=Schizopora paradoxa TaxID=27342 RepID=A0A0H2R4R2_9AGAM|nr:hypothetical protein SCHPADRAFT_678614 [Schizopora paradoxa]